VAAVGRGERPELSRVQFRAQYFIAIKNINWPDGGAGPIGPMDPTLARSARHWIDLSPFRPKPKDDLKVKIQVILGPKVETMATNPPFEPDIETRKSTDRGLTVAMLALTPMG
jgi:hypothetical protein